MRATQLLLALPLVISLVLAGCQSDSLTGPAGDQVQSATGPLSPADDTCDPNLIPC